jgi:hypothetical protein
MAKLKTFKNSIRLDGKSYYSSAHLMNLGKSFNNAEFVKVGNQIFYAVSLK